MADRKVQFKRAANPRYYITALYCDICGEALGRPGSPPAIKVGGGYRHKYCKPRPQFNRLPVVYSKSPQTKEN